MPSLIVLFSLLFQPGPDGALLKREAYSFPLETYEAWLETMNGRGLQDWSILFDKGAFDRYQENRLVSGSKIVYASSGLKIHGFLFVPENRKGKLPAVIYNRGALPSGHASHLGDPRALPPGRAGICGGGVLFARCRRQ